MSLTVTQAMVEQFKANVILLSQQKNTRLQQACQVAEVTGKSFYAERMGATEMYERTTRHGDVHPVNTPHSRRKGIVHDMEWVDYLDKADGPKTLIDIQGKYVQLAVAAANRAKDMWILRALGGAAHSGESGGTTVNNYDAGECRIIQGDGTLATAGSDASDTTETDLDVTKVLLAKYLLDAAEIDEDRQRYFVTNAYNIDALLKDTTYGSEEWKTVRDIKNGKMEMFQGFMFVPIEYRSTGTGLQYHTTDTGCIRSYAFAQGAVTFGVGQDIQTVIERNPQKNAQQITADMSVGAERNEGPAVVEMLLKAAA